MNVISFKLLRGFYEVHPDTKKYLTSWFKAARKANWKDFNAVRQDFKSADLIGDNRIIFNIKGNHYRMIVRISYDHKRIMIKWIGSHAEYDKINASKI